MPISSSLTDGVSHFLANFYIQHYFSKIIIFLIFGYINTIWFFANPQALFSLFWFKFAFPLGNLYFPLNGGTIAETLCTFGNLIWRKSRHLGFYFVFKQLAPLKAGNKVPKNTKNGYLIAKKVSKVKDTHWNQKGGHSLIAHNLQNWEAKRAHLSAPVFQGFYFI